MLPTILIVLLILLLIGEHRLDGQRRSVHLSPTRPRRPQAPCFVVNARHYDLVHSPNRSAGMELCFFAAIMRW
jgi:hypothetical protein